MPEETTGELYESICERWRELEDSEKRGLLDALKVSVTYNSTKLENDRIDIHDARAILRDGSVANYTGELRDLYEIDNHGRAWSAVCDSALDGSFEGLNAESLLRLHLTVTEHTYDADRARQGEQPGTFKLHDYGVGIDQEVGLPPEDCPGAVADLLEEVNGYLGEGLSIQNSLICASYLHAKLVDIHPFADGNGRVARLAQNLYLMALGHPPIAQRVEDKMAYFGALDQFHEEGALSGLVVFNRVETCLTWQGSDLLGR